MTIQLLVLRNWRSLEPAFQRHVVPRVVLCQVATLPILAAGVGCWAGVKADCIGL